MIEVHPMLEEHSLDVLRIYQEGIDTGLATFETLAPIWERWDSAHLMSSRFVAFENGCVVGWAALSPVSDRCVYSGVAEISIYISVAARGLGVGSALMKKIVEDSERNGIWTLNAGMFPENGASIALHKKFGFRVVGRREKIGQMNGVWRDTLLLERRSLVVGIED